MIGFGHAQNANVALTTDPYPESAAKAAILIESKQLLDVVSHGMFTTMEELRLVFTDAMGYVATAKDVTFGVTSTPCS